MSTYTKLSVVLLLGLLGEEEGRQRGEEAAQLSWQTCLKVAARLSRGRGTQRKKERVERKQGKRKQEGRRRQGKGREAARGVGDCTRPHTKEMEKQRTTKHKYETRNSKEEADEDEAATTSEEGKHVHSCRTSPHFPPVKLLL